MAFSHPINSETKLKARYQFNNRSEVKKIISYSIIIYDILCRFVNKTSLMKWMSTFTLDTKFIYECKSESQKSR